MESSIIKYYTCEFGVLYTFLSKPKQQEKNLQAAWLLSSSAFRLKKEKEQSMNINQNNPSYNKNGL